MGMMESNVIRSTVTVCTHWLTFPKSSVAVHVRMMIVEKVSVQVPGIDMST